MWFNQFFVTWQRFLFDNLLYFLLWLFLVWSRFLGCPFPTFKRSEGDVVFDFHVVALWCNFINRFILYGFHQSFVQNFLQFFNMLVRQARLVWNYVTLLRNFHFQLKCLIFLISLIVDDLKPQLFLIRGHIWWTEFRNDRALVKGRVSNFKFFIINCIEPAIKLHNYFVVVKFSCRGPLFTKIRVAHFRRKLQFNGFQMNLCLILWDSV